MPACNLGILIYRKVDDAATFDRSWNEFKIGFGNPGSFNYWIGNDQLHNLTVSIGYTRLCVNVTALFTQQQVKQSVLYRLLIGIDSL